MGSVRRGLERFALTSLLPLFPTFALAEVCDKERPNWTRADGPATAWDEFIHLTTLPITMALIVMAAMAFATHWRRLQGFAALLWGLMALLQISENAVVFDDIRWFAIQEGCIGPPYLFIGFAIAICAGMIVGAMRPRPTGDS